jgi:predicted RNase H-like HicB family nuclease
MQDKRRIELGTADSVGRSVMARDYDVIIERDAEGFLVASVPTLPGCHTQARSMDVLMERIQEAVLLCLEERDEEPEQLEFVGIQRLRGA